MDNNDTHRIIGALQEFKETTEARLDKIDTHLEGLIGFKLKIVGGVAVVVAVVQGAAWFLK